MFIEKLSKKELVDFIKKIGYEPKQEMPDIKLNKDGDALVLISCEPTKLQKDLYQQVLNYSGIGYFCDNTPYYMGTTLALTDFDCYDILHMEKNIMMTGNNSCIKNLATNMSKHSMLRLKNKGIVNKTKDKKNNLITKICASAHIFFNNSIENIFSNIQKSCKAFVFVI